MRERGSPQPCFKGGRAGPVLKPVASLHCIRFDYIMVKVLGYLMFYGGMEMDVKDYFEKTDGLGILATADSNLQPDVAVYSRPHFMDDGTIAFIMLDRLSHKNLQSNPHAAYLFIERTGKENGRLSGKRLYLTRVGEEKNSELLYKLRRKSGEPSQEDRYLVYFKIDKIRPLTGG